MAPRRKQIQHVFNVGIIDNLKQVQLALGNGKEQYTGELLTECLDSLHRRNKLIRIADTSEGGWETVRQYESNPVVSDSDDETKIKRAEYRAIKKRKTDNQERGKKKFKSFHPASQGRSDTQRSFDAPTSFAYQQQQMTQRGFRVEPFLQGPRAAIGPCFSCGGPHFRRDCPYVRPAAGQLDTSTVDKR